MARPLPTLSGWATKKELFVASLKGVLEPPLAIQGLQKTKWIWCFKKFFFSPKTIVNIKRPRSFWEPLSQGPQRITLTRAVVRGVHGLWGPPLEIQGVWNTKLFFTRDSCKYKASTVLVEPLVSGTLKNDTSWLLWGIWVTMFNRILFYVYWIPCLREK